MTNKVKKEVAEGGQQNDKKEANAGEVKLGEHNNDKNNNRKGGHVSNAQAIDYAGQTKDLGAILALRNERFNHKVIFSTFIEKLKVYVLTNFSHASDMLPIVESLTDPTEDVINDEPTEVSPTEATLHVKVWLKQEQVKNHIKRIRDLESNKQSLYGIVWGQLSNGLQEFIKADSSFDRKASAFDCVWLLEKAKLASSGVDQRANKHATLIKALTNLCNIWQGATESNDSYRKRVDAYALTLSLSGGNYVMCSPELIDAEDKDYPSIEEEEEHERDKFKAMILVLRVDPV